MSDVHDARRSGGVANGGTTYRNLHVSLPIDISDVQLRSLFEPFGNIESVRVIREVTTAVSLGYGFVQFSRTEEGCSAFGALNGKTVTVGDQSFVITVSASDLKHLVSETRKVFICNIPTSTPATEVRKFFEPFGAVVEYSERIQDIREGPRQQRTRAERTSLVPKRQLSITYGTVEEARRAINACHGRTIFRDGDVPLLAKYAEESHPRRRRGGGTSPPSPSSAPMHPQRGPPEGGPALAHTPHTPHTFAPSIPTQVPMAHSLPMPQAAQWPLPTGIFGMTPNGVSFGVTPSDGMGLPMRVAGLPAGPPYLYFAGLLQRHDDGTMIPVRIDTCREVDAVPMPVYVPVAMGQGPVGADSLPAEVET